jgi:hypothetical protein
MDIHKPKPVHGLRDFLAEVGIIVLGVLLALAAEQAVEAMHWAHKVEQAKDPLKGELHDIYVSAAERIETEACLNQRLDALEAKVLAAGATWAAAGAPGTPPGASSAEVYHTPYRIWGDSVWRSVEAEGLGSHLSQKTRLGLSFVYNEAVRAREENALEWRDGARFSILNRPIATDPTTRAQLLSLIQSQRQANKLLTIMGRQIVDRVRTDRLLQPVPTEAEVKAELASVPGTLRWCADADRKG